MTKETIYGIISDIHNRKDLLPRAIEKLKDEGIDKLLINGDIGNEKNKPQDTINYYAAVLEIIGKSNLESYVQPGSHESLFTYSIVMDYFSDKYPNIVDATKNQKIEHNGHTLVFLPGSDFLCGGQYLIGNNDHIPSGRYLVKYGVKLDDVKNEKWVSSKPFETLDEYLRALKEGRADAARQYSNMNDLRTLVSDPDTTISVCHIPRRFDNLENAVDVSHFWQGRVYHRNPKNMKDWTYTESSIAPMTIPKNVLEERTGSIAFTKDFSEGKILKETLNLIEKENVERWQVFVEREENRGNKDLKSLYEEKGINKAVSGHFHESGHRAHDRKGNPILPDEEVDELYWNSGHFEKGQFGILYVDGNKVKYKNIKL